MLDSVIIRLHHAAAAIALAALVSLWLGHTAQAQPAPQDLRVPKGNPAVQNQGNHRHQLRHLSVGQLHQRLEKAFGRKIPLLRDDGSPWSRMIIEEPAVGGQQTQPLVVSGNVHTGELRIAGRPAQLKAWGEILTALDQAPQPAAATQLVATTGKSDAKIRQVVNLILAQNSRPANSQPASPPRGAPQAPAAAGDGQAALNSLLGPVQIEFVEGTKYLIIRGKPEDVARVEQIISQLEALSTVAEPKISVHTLKHVDSAAIAPLVQRAFDANFSEASLARTYGPLVVVPLVNPNAVLFIGQESPVVKAVELINKLDTPGKALTQFEVFRLQFANAEEVRIVLENALKVDPAEGVAALSAKAVIISDRRTNALIVRAGPRDMEEVRALVKEIDRVGGDAESELQIFKLSNSVATDLVPVLRETLLGSPDQADSDAARRAAALLRLVVVDEQGRRQLESGVLSKAQITADQRANAVVVKAPKNAMPLIAAFIKQLDQAPDTTAELKVFTIENGDAVSLSEMLESLFGDAGQGNNADNPTPFQLRFSVDERTNSIIAAGSRDELIVAEAILMRLDASDARERENRVYKLRNADAEQVAQALQDWLAGRRDVEETAPGVVSPFQQIEREVVVVPEINSNSLIVSAAPKYYQELTRIITELDEQAPMVMIQVLIGEVRLGDADEFGVELGLQDSLLFDRSLLSDIQRSTVSTTVTDAGGGSTVTEDQRIDSATFTPGFGFGDPGRGLGNAGSSASLATAGKVAAQGLSSFAVGRTNPNLGFGGLVLSASSESVSMLLRALQESRRLEVLSRPQIMALDNQTGKAFVGEVVPIITSSNIDQFGRQQNIVEPQKVGLELEVLPRISPDGLVVMQVFAQKSELGPLDQGIPIAVAPNGDPIRVPRILQTLAETTISAVDGQTVVLSGLLTKRDSALHRRVPLLADIPLLGDLFRYDSTSTQRSELLIILTPHIVKNRYEAEMLKQVESARMNWCLSDVVDLQGGNGGLRSHDDQMGAAQAETVYPSEGYPTESQTQDGSYPNALPPGVIVPEYIPQPGPTHSSSKLTSEATTALGCRSDTAG